MLGFRERNVSPARTRAWLRRKTASARLRRVFDFGTVPCLSVSLVPVGRMLRQTSVRRRFDIMRYMPPFRLGRRTGELPRAVIRVVPLRDKGSDASAWRTGSSRGIPCGVVGELRICSLFTSNGSGYVNPCDRNDHRDAARGTGRAACCRSTCCGQPAATITRGVPPCRGADA